jgi:hypothetical protein
LEFAASINRAQTALMPPIPKRPTGLLASLLTLVAGCASYHAAPISAAQNAHAIHARSLDDARLQEFIAATRGTDAAPDGGDAAWDLTTLTLAALYYHPTLDLARANVDEARAGVLTARQVPNPSLSFEDLAFTPGAAAGTAWTVAPIINFLIETSGKHRRSGRAAASGARRAGRRRLAGAGRRTRCAYRDLGGRAADRAGAQPPRHPGAARGAAQEPLRCG